MQKVIVIACVVVAVVGAAWLFEKQGNSHIIIDQLEHTHGLRDDVFMRQLKITLYNTGEEGTGRVKIFDLDGREVPIIPNRSLSPWASFFPNTIVNPGYSGEAIYFKHRERKEIEIFISPGEYHLHVYSMQKKQWVETEEVYVWVRP